MDHFHFLTCLDKLTVMVEPAGTPNRVVCRRGLGSRGNGDLDREAVLAALDRGIDYLDWCGQPDGRRDAIRQLDTRRRQVRIAVMHHKVSSMIGIGRERLLNRQPASAMP
jgi:hypothetical protein